MDPSSNIDPEMSWWDLDEWNHDKIGGFVEGATLLEGHANMKQENRALNVSTCLNLQIKWQCFWCFHGNWTFSTWKNAPWIFIHGILRYPMFKQIQLHPSCRRNRVLLFLGSHGGFPGFPKWGYPQMVGLFPFRYRYTMIKMVGGLNLLSIKGDDEALIIHHLWWVYIHIYLVGGWATSLKNMSSSIGMMTFPTEWKKNMFQTTNQKWMI